MSRRSKLLAGVVLVLALVLVLVVTLPQRVPNGGLLEALWTTGEVLERPYGDETGPAEFSEAAVSALAAAAEIGEEDLADEMAEVDADVPGDVPDGYAPVWRAWQVAAAGVSYDDAPDLVAATIRGMVAATGDPRARVVSGDYRGEREYFDDEQTGIGALVEQRDDRLVIGQPFPGGPAARAGVQLGDVLVAVDGRPVRGLDVGTVVEMIRGPAGSKVALRLAREDAGEVEVTVRRDTLPITSAGSRDLPGGIGYLQITHFADDAPEVVADQLDRLSARGMRALILDLRANPGGRPSAAVGVADQFLDRGVAYVAEDLDGERSAVRLTRGARSPELPVALLVDQRTSGAAELFVAMLRDHQRAPVFGLPTPGDVALYRPHQVAEELAVVVRGGRWYPPSGTDLRDNGIQPDLPVGLLPEDVELGYDRPMFAANAYLWDAIGGAAEAG